MNSVTNAPDLIALLPSHSPQPAPSHHADRIPFSWRGFQTCYYVVFASGRRGWLVVDVERKRKAYR